MHWQRLLYHFEIGVTCIDDDGGADDDNYLDDADNRRFQFLQHGYTSSFTLGRGSVLAPDSPMSGVSEATSGSYASSAQPV